MRKFLAILLLGLMAISVIIAWPKSGLAADTGSEWKQALSGTSRDLRSVIYGNGLWVAVGAKGTILTSTNGIKWSQSKSGTEQDISGVTFANGMFVAVDNDNALLSSDGVTWTSYSVRAAGSSGSLNSVAYGNNVFVAVGLPYQYYSTDGKTWNRTDTLEDMRAVAFGDGVFVAASFRGLFASQDGRQWTKATSNESSTVIFNLLTVSYSNGKFVAGGRIQQGNEYLNHILVSSDGVNWSVQNIPDPPATVGFRTAVHGSCEIESKLIIIDWNNSAQKQFLFASLDGTSWASAASPPGTVSACSSGKGLTVAVGPEGNLFYLLKTGEGQGSGQGGSGNAQPPSDIQQPTPQNPGNETAPGSQPTTGGATINPAVPPGDQAIVRPATSTEIGTLVIKATQATLTNDVEEYSGTILLNRNLYLQGRLSIDRRNYRASGSGRLYVVLDSGTSLNLYDGDFTIDADAATLLKMAGTSKLQLAGLDVTISSLKLIDGGVSLAATLKVPKAMGGGGAELRQLRIQNGRISTDVSVTLPSMSFGTSGWGLNDATLQYNSDNNQFIGSATLNIPKLFAVKGTLGLRDARLERVGVALDHLNLAIDASGLFFTKLGASASNLDNFPDISLGIEAAISGGPSILGYSAVKGDSLTVNLDLGRGRLSGSGKLKVVEQDLLNTSFSISKEDGFIAQGEADFFHLIQGKATLTITSDYFGGTIVAMVRVPESVPFLGGRTLGEGELALDGQGVHVYGKVAFLASWCLVTWDGDWECHRGSPTGAEFQVAKEYRVPLLALVGSASIGTADAGTQFEIPAGSYQVLVQLTWDQGDTDFTLSPPGGAVITPQNATGDKAVYWKSPTAHEAWYALNAPVPGTWKYSITTPNPQATYRLVVTTVTQPPSWEFTAPTSGVTGNSPVSINWAATAPLGSTIDLFYDPVGMGYAGKPIALNLDASSGHYVWNPTGVSSGRYFVYGVLKAGDYARISHYAPGDVTVVNNHTPTTPTAIAAIARNGRIVVTWAPSTGTSLAGYTLRVGNGVSSVSVSKDRNSYEWDGLANDRSYQVTISAYSVDGLESPPSLPIEVFLPTPNPPKMSISWPVQRLTNVGDITLSIDVEKDISVQVFRNGERVSGPVIGPLSPKVPLAPGRNTLQVVAARPNGDTAEAAEEYVLDDLPPVLMFENVKSPSTVTSSILQISGVTEPPAKLQVGAAVVPVQPDGHFTAHVKLSPGLNRIKVEAIDPAGNRIAQEIQVTYEQCGGVFPDVPADMDACGAIQHLYSLKVLSGYPDGNFYPSQGVTRAEFAKMLAVALRQEPQPDQQLAFTDVSAHWASTKGYLQAAVALGALQGFPDGTFRPDELVTRSQAVKIAAAAAGRKPSGISPYSDIKETDWFSGWVAIASRTHLIGSGSAFPLWTGNEFLGEEPATRAEAAMLLANLLGQQ